jgi:hypothetical protein
MVHNKSKNWKFLALSIVSIGFLFSIIFNQRNYQDTWILDGIVFPTAIFVFFFLVAETFTQDNKKLVILSAAFLAVINLVPGIKYPLFCNVFDAPAHFRFTNEIASLGYIPENERLSEQYAGNPGMHIFMACISIVSGISTNDVLRLIVPALSGLAPFIIYFITKDRLDNTIQRYVILASSFPIVQRYMTYGTSLAMLPYILLIAIFVRNIFTKTNKRTLWLLFVVLSFNLIISHAITSLFVCTILIVTLFILKFIEIMRKSTLRWFQVNNLIVPSLLYVVLLVAWWMYASAFNLNTLGDLIRSIFVGETEAPVPTRFHRIQFLPQLQVLAVFHLRDAIIGLLTIFGLFIFLRKSRRNELDEKIETFYVYIIVILATFALFLSFEFVSGFGSIEYGRFIAYAMPLFVLLVGLALWRLDKFLNTICVKPGVRNLAFASFLFILVSSCLIQFYRFQPLVPRSNVLSTDLPENEYLVYFGVVNTIFQTEMISFAGTHSHGARIASDLVTRHQIYGFSGPSFFSRHTYFSPLVPNQNRNLGWDLFLLHTAEAGGLSEPAEYRTRERIENLRLKAGNLIYDNGESFIISYCPYNYYLNQQ